MRVGTPKKGFTIVELLIVIVVIAILATITIVSFNGIQGRARDTQRRSDIGIIYRYAASYVAEIGNSPSTTSGCWIARSYNTGAACENLNNLSTISQYVSTGKLPFDPINDATYNYIYAKNVIKNPSGAGVVSGGSGDFAIVARLEGSSDPTFTYAGGTYNYVVSNR